MNKYEIKPADDLPRSEAGIPTITLTVQIKTPVLPTFVEIESAKYADLDDAIAAGGKGMVVDISVLDAEAIERIGRQWTDALLSLAASRRVGVRHV